MHDMSNTRKEIAARLGFAAGNGAKTRMDRSDGNYFLISAMVDNAPTGERSFDTKAEAEYYGKQMLEATKQANPKAKSVKVSLMEVVNMSPQAPFKTLSARLGAKVAFDNKQIAQGLSRLLKETGFDGMASDVLSGSSDSETLRKYVRVLKGKMSPLSGDAKSAELLSKLEKMLSSRPGAKTRMTREQTEEQKAGLKIMSAADAAIGAKIATLIKEGKPQDQAVAIALDMKRRGEL